MSDPAPRLRVGTAAQNRGAFSPIAPEWPVDPPEPHALIAGHVLEAEERHNAVTGKPFWWALVESVGGTFDVVIDPDLISAAPNAGQVLTGWFWLSGRLEPLAAVPKAGWLRKLTGRS